MLPTTRLNETNEQFKQQIKKADEDIQKFKKENDILTKQASELIRPQYFEVLEKLQHQIEAFESQLSTLQFNLDIMQQKTNKLSCEIVAVDYLKEKSKPFPKSYFVMVLDELKSNYADLTTMIEQNETATEDPKMIIPAIKNMYGSLEWLEQTYKSLHEHVQTMSSEYDRIKLQHNVMDQGGLKIQEYAQSLTPSKNLQPFNTTANPTFGQSNSFGQPATTSFGPATNSFGQPAATFGQPTTTFGQPATTNSFGQPTNSFGQPATTFGQPTNSFGQPATSSGFSFGQTNLQTPKPATAPSFSFGVNK